MKNIENEVFSDITDNITDDATFEIAQAELLKNFKPLGYNDGVYYFIGATGKQVVGLSPKDMVQNNLLQLADYSAWEQCFPMSLKNGIPNGVKWVFAANFAISICQESGVYNPSNIRGRGYWYDDKLIRHNGENLIINGEIKELTDHNTKYIYERAVKINSNSNIQPATKDTIDTIKNAVTRIYWSKKTSAKLFLGWAILAPFCGALDWRPHILISGAKACGKSNTAAPFLKALIHEDNFIWAEGETSSAGIRQELKADAFPVMVDELEVQSHKDQHRVEAIFSLSRNSSASGGGKVFKGSPSGKSKTFNIRSMFCYLGINVQQKQEADESRTTVLEIDLKKETDESRKAFASVANTIDWINEEDIAEQIIKFGEINFKALQDNIRVFSLAVSKCTSDSRKGKQYGSLLAGYYFITSYGKVATEQQAMELAKEIDDDEVTARHDTQTDEDRCLSSILDVTMRLDAENNTTLTVGEALTALANDDKSVFARAEGRHTSNDDYSSYGCGKSIIEDRLRRYGVVYMREIDKFFLANKNTDLKNGIDDQMYKDWLKILKRLDGVESGRSVKPVLINGQTKRGMLIPFNRA